MPTSQMAILTNLKPGLVFLGWCMEISDKLGHSNSRNSVNLAAFYLFFERIVNTSCSIELRLKLH